MRHKRGRIWRMALWRKTRRNFQPPIRTYAVGDGGARSPVQAYGFCFRFEAAKFGRVRY